MKIAAGEQHMGPPPQHAAMITKLIRYFGKYLNKADPDRFERVDAIANSLTSQRKKVKDLLTGIIDEKRDVLMGVEGVARRLYWQAASEIIGSKTEFMGREHRGATDAVNAAPNYGYGILYGNVWGAALNAGLQLVGRGCHLDAADAG